MDNHLGFTFGQITPDTASIRDEEMLDGAAIHNVMYVSGRVYVECTYVEYDDFDGRFPAGHEIFRMTVQGRSSDHFLDAVRVEYDRRCEIELLRIEATLN